MITMSLANSRYDQPFQFLRLYQPEFTCLKLTTETLEQGVDYRSGVFIVNFEHISHLVLVILLLTLNM